MTVPELLPALEDGLTEGEFIRWIQWSLGSAIAAMIGHEGVNAYTKGPRGSRGFDD
jgi:hypothetical protein